MRTSWRHLPALALLAGAAALVAGLPRPARAVAEPGDDAAEAPRRLPLRVRDDPERYARLKAEWHRFMKLPKEKQERLRKLDDDLHDEDPATQARLWAVLDRYATWLDRLDDKDRKQVESAAGGRKLEIIKSLRERDWVARQPKALRDRVEAAPAAERTALVEARRQDERKRQAEWHLAQKIQNDPIPRFPLAEFRPELQLYVEKSLTPMLTPPERGQLFASRGDWPAYAATLKALSDRHPVRVPPSEKPGKTAIKDLPQDLQKALRLRGDRRGMGGFDGGPLRGTAGRWPDFALAVVDLAKRKGVTTHEPLGPCTPQEFVPAVQDFIKELRKDKEAARRLGEAQGKWPDYPFAVMELAKEKKKRVPGTHLPGPPGFWEKAKAPPRE